MLKMEHKQTENNLKKRTGHENMRPYQLDPTRTQEEVRELAAKGGRKSGETRRKKRDFKNRLKWMMEHPVEDGGLKDILKKYGVDNPDYYDVVQHALFREAAAGDVHAQKYLDEKLGQNPTFSIKLREIELKEKMAQEEPHNFENDGFLEALTGKVDNLDWDEENPEEDTIDDQPLQEDGE